VYSASARRAADEDERRLAPPPLPQPPLSSRRPSGAPVRRPDPRSLDSPELRHLRQQLHTRPPRRAEPREPARPAGGPATQAAARPAAPERGLPGWGALLLLVGLAAGAGLIDTAANIQVRGTFNIGIVVASGITILAVRRSDMLPVVLAPPIVYSGAAMFMLYVRSGGFHNKHEVINAALNYLVYGFPAIATATGVVLVIAAIRMLVKR
jgi:hypothetical protein